MDFIINHWEALSSLLLSCVAISIAIISSYQTSKQAKEQIAGIKEMTETSTKNADKQIEEIKRMTNQMVIDTKKHLISMKSTAVALVEYYLLNLESSISISKKEVEKINDILKNMTQDIQDADKKAERDTNANKYFELTGTAPLSLRADCHVLQCWQYQGRTASACSSRYQQKYQGLSPKQQQR